MASLDPFLDDSGDISVGGRLQQSQLPYDTKHPIVLNPSAHITRLIIEREHIRLLHAGAQLVHHSLRQRWWIVNAKLVIRSIIRKCVKFRGLVFYHLLELSLIHILCECARVLCNVFK